MECNLKEVVDKGVPYKRNKAKFKDSFVGQINQLKTTQAVAPERKSLLPEIDVPNPWITEEKKKLKPKTEKSMKSACDLYAQINDTTFAKVQDRIPNSRSVVLSKA